MLTRAAAREIVWAVIAERLTADLKAGASYIVGRPPQEVAFMLHAVEAARQQAARWAKPKRQRTEATS